MATTLRYNEHGFPLQDNWALISASTLDEDVRRQAWLKVWVEWYNARKIWWENKRKVYRWEETSRRWVRVYGWHNSKRDVKKRDYYKGLTEKNPPRCKGRSRPEDPLDILYGQPDPNLEPPSQPIPPVELYLQPRCYKKRGI